MNSEELEISLRTEFESYLKDIFAEMRQELSQLQEKVASEIERHKSTLDGTFSEAMSRLENDKEIDAGFKDSVTEHLRLSRDEGARITAMAIAEAEEMEKASAAVSPVAVAPVSTGIKEIHEAIGDISTKTSQAEILKSLVHHAANFAPRGAFFIIKNEHLVGWRVFGKDKTVNDEKVREVFLSVSSDSILSQAVKTLETVESPAGTYADDAEILDKLEFGEPHKMAAIPLVARGRGVAVLYADHDTEDAEVNIEALEALTRVAGLTVEVLASAKTAAAGKKDSVKKQTAELTEENSAPVVQPQEETPHYQETGEYSYEPTATYETPVAESTSESDVKHDFESVPEYSFEPAVAEPVSEHTVEPVADIYKTNVDITELTPSHSENTEEVKDEPVSSSFVSDDYDVETIEPTPVATEEKYPAFEGNSWSQSAEENAWTKPAETTDYSAQEYAQNFAKETDPAEYAKDFSIQPSIEPTEPVPSTNNYEFETGYDLTPTEPVITTQDEKFGSFEVENGKAEASFPESFETVSQPVETVSQPVSTPPKSRLSERNVDLPIEVSEDERRLHNDARRFARLLVSEIKLYNEQKVKEGRDAGDIYERLREAIDRSREMYDKRVQPAVAAKFDYFHYELVNTLAEGDDKKLGAGYPGAVV